MLNCRPVANQTERATSITQPRAFPRCRPATIHLTELPAEGRRRRCPWYSPRQGALAPTEAGYTI